MNNKPLQAHLSMFAAEAMWGLMSPVGKDAMNHGIDGLSMVSFRMMGAALLFWVASQFAKREHVPMRDVLLFGGAALLGVVFNQCLFTIGLSVTSPINASIVTTSMPIFAMILAALILHEPITMKKALGVAIGCAGAVTLILTSASSGNARVGDIRGDLLCMGAQLSYALYLSLFNKLVRKYSVVTVNKWMFTYACLIILPFTSHHVANIDFAAVPTSTWWETAFVVGIGTYVAYMLMMVGQTTLRPTVVSIYNYVQPVVSVIVSVLTGIGVFSPAQGVAIVLVCIGVWMVTKSKSRRDMENDKTPSSH